MEILGAVAAAIQLAQVGTKVIKLPFLLLSQFQDAPTSVQKRENQIQHLVAIARAIECSTALQTKLIESLLRRCSQEAKYLKALLTPLIAGSGMRKIARNWKAIAGVMKEKRISATYKRLEEEKSALTLCIVSIDANETAKVSDSVHQVIQQLPTIQDIASGVEGLLKELNGFELISMSLRTGEGCSVERLLDIPYINTTQ